MYARIHFKGNGPFREMKFASTASVEEVRLGSLASLDSNELECISALYIFNVGALHIFKKGSDQPIVFPGNPAP